MEQFDKYQLEKTDQQLFTDSFNVCWEILKSKEYYLCEHETNILSRLSLNYGQDMYDAMMIIMNKIIKSNEHQVAVEKLKVESIKSGTAEATRNLGYDDNYDELNQQQQQKQQVNKVYSKDKMTSKKRKVPVDEIHSKKMFKADIKKNNCNDSSNAENIQTASSNENSINKLDMSDFIEKEEELFIEESMTIKDKMLPVTDDLIDVDEMNNSDDHSIRLEIKSNEISNLFNGNNQSSSNNIIDNVDHQKNTIIRSRSLSSKKYNFCTKEDDKLSSTTDENLLDDNDDDDNSLNQNENLEDKIKVYDAISFEEKTRVIKLAREHPTWSINMLREHSGCKNIKDRCQIEVWKNQIERGGTWRQKINLVNNWVVNKCVKNQKKGKIITNEKIKTWGLEGKKIFKPTQFSASVVWLSKLKKNYDITGEPYNLKINCNVQKKKSSLYSKICVPHEIKVKVVNLANENPHWSLKMLREQSGCNNLENISQLYNWKYAVNNFNKKRATGSKVPRKSASTSVQYDNEDNDTKKIINSNQDKVAVEKSKVGSIKIVTTEVTRDSGYDDNYNQLNQQQQKQVDKVIIDINNSQDNKTISKRRKTPVDEIHSKMFKADYEKNNCDDSNNAENIQFASSNKNSIEKLHMIDFIKKEEELFTKESITIKDEMLSVTDDLIDVNKIHNSDNQSIVVKIKSNEISNSFNNNNQSYSNEVIENVDHEKNKRIRTGSLARKKYSFYSKEDDKLSSTTDENYLDDDVFIKKNGH